MKYLEKNYLKNLISEIAVEFEIGLPSMQESGK